MSTQPEQPKLLEDSLLRDLENTPTNTVRDATKRAERFSEEDEANHKRGLKSQARATVVKLKRWYLHVLFGVFSILTICLAFGFAIGVWLYVSSFVNDPEKLGSFLANVAVWLLIALATLFIERVIPDRD